MGENTNQIEQEIRERRSDLGRNLEELEGRAREMVDWRAQYKKHSPVALGAAFGIGVALALMALPKRNGLAADYVDEFEPDTSHDPTVEPRRSWASQSHTVARARREFGDTWEQISDALFRTGSAVAVQLAASLVPGLSEHLEPRPPQQAKSRTWGSH